MGTRSKGPFENPVSIICGGVLFLTDHRQKTGREFNPLPRPPKFLVCPHRRKFKKRHAD